MGRRFLHVTTLQALLILHSATAGADSLGVINEPPAAGPQSEFHPGRLVFDHGAHSNRGPGRPWWRIDWPDAEMHLTAGIQRYTRIDTARDSVHLRLSDEALFDYPWLLAQQVGRWRLSDAEIARLADYLSRGGFLVVDDFHGPHDWQVFSDVMSQVLPNHRVVDIDAGNPLLNVLYELDQRTQIPGRRHVLAASDDSMPVIRMPYSPPRWRAIQDDNGQLLVAINYNMDMGDSWEHADDPGYPVTMTSLGYRFGINYVLYAMTH